MESKCPKIRGSNCLKMGGSRCLKIGGSNCPKIGGSKCPKSKKPTAYVTLSSPRAERARAVTVRQCPTVHCSGVGQDFLLRRRVTLTETAVTRKRKV